MNDQHFDLVVIGGGPGGYVAAIRASQLGMKTALIEKAELGGICLNWGCIPTKAMLRSADVFRLVKSAEDFGITVDEAKIDLDKIVVRSREVSKKLQQGVLGLLNKNKVTVFHAEARLLGHGKLTLKTQINQQTISAKHIILATGARAKTIPNMQVDGKYFWSYREALVPKNIPKSLVIVGAGAIGIEFACFYQALGTKVTVIELADRVLPQEDEDISKSIEIELKKSGITIFTGCKISHHKIVHDHVELTLEGLSSEKIRTETVLLSVGISANSENLGLENTKIKLDRGHVITDEFCQTAEPNVYAIGDLAGPPWLAHKASHEGILCVEKIMGLETHALDLKKIAACTYSHPQVASLGYTETQARESGKKFKVGKFPFAANGKAIAMGATAGFIKVIFDETSGELLGAHMIGDEVTEMINGYAFAQTLETTEHELIQTIIPHPTMSESMHEAVLTAYNRVIHQ
nr:dihydrolipoyl dehydrogenase [Acinetobacter sp. Marseille-Q1620]